jgi:hypothetical protein
MGKSTTCIKLVVHCHSFLVTTDLISLAVGAIFYNRNEVKIREAGLAKEQGQAVLRPNQEG